MIEEVQVKESEIKVAETNQTNQLNESPVVETAEEINWRQFRKDREKERRAKEESDKRAIEKEEEATRLKAAMEVLLSKQQSEPSHPNLDDVEESEEQRIDRRVEQVLAKDREAQRKELMLKESRELPQKLLSTYSDFNVVLSRENIDYIDYHYPEVARRFKSAPDDYETWSDLYKFVKRTVPNYDSKKDQERIDKNLSKPQSLSLPGMAEGRDQVPSMQLDEQRKKDNWMRMQRVIKGGR